MNKADKRAYNAVRKFAKKSKLKYFTGYHPKKEDLKFDFYFPSKNVGVDIKQHVNGAKKAMQYQAANNKKDDYCKQNGIKLISFSGNDYQELKNALK